MSDIVITIVYFVTLVGAQIVGAFLILGVGYFLPDTVPLQYQIIASQLISIIIPTIAYFGISNKKFETEIPLEPLGVKNTLLAIIIALFIQPSMLLLSAITSLFVPNVATDIISQMIYGNSYISLLAIALTPAICEEVALRGVILSGFKKLSLLPAVLLNGLLFSILHLSIQQSLYAFALGVLFAYLVRITKSLRISMLIHFIINGSQFLLAKQVMLIQDNLLIEETPEIEMLQIIALAVFALITLPIVILCIYFIKKNSTTQIKEL